MKKKGIFLLAGVLVLGILASALQTHLKVQTYQLTSSKITSPVRLAVITDLHSTIYDENQEKLVALLEAQEPDAVLLSGDIADDEVPHDARNNCWMPLEIHILVSMFPVTMNTGRENMRKLRK